MSDHNLILTYDIGTTGNKCTVFGSQGREMQASTVPYGTIFPKSGWAEQDPMEFWQSVIIGTRELIEKWGMKPSDIAVIGLSGHMNGCIPVDDQGNVLYNNIIHSDCRSSAQCDYIAERVDFNSFYQITGNRLDPHYTLPKVLWLKDKHPEVYNKTRYFLNTKDYISYRLTGTLGLTDFSDASLTCMLDINNKDWAYDLLQTLGVDTNKLPALHRSFDLAGGLSNEAAQLLGLLEGTPVVVGGGDGACAARGSGLTGTGDTYNYLGSSSWIGTLCDTPILDKAARIFNYYDLDGSHINVCGAIQSAAASYNWAVEMFGETAGVKGSEGNQNDVYDKVEVLARSSPIGSNGVIFLPYLMGERTPHWDVNARGAFVGFSLYHNRGDMLRSVYEGVGYALRNVLDVFIENQINIQALTLIGGGAKSKLWNEILCNVLNKSVKVHKSPGVATSLGAAIAAGVGVGIFKDMNTAITTVYDREYNPEELISSAYEKYYKIYQSIYPRLKPVYDEIAKL